MGAMQLDDAAFQQLLDALAEILKDLDLDLSELAQHLLSNNTGQLEKMLRDAAAAAQVQNIQRSFQEGRYSHSMAQMLGPRRARARSSTRSRTRSATPTWIRRCASSCSASSTAACRISPT